MERENNACRFFVDGQDYYESVYTSLLKAKKEIFITGWWISPELYLRRPVSDTLNQESRLDRVLLNRAKAGVSINIIIYNAPSRFT